MNNKKLHEYADALYNLRKAEKLYAEEKAAMRMFLRTENQLKSEQNKEHIPPATLMKLSDVRNRHASICTLSKKHLKSCQATFAWIYQEIQK